MFLFLNFLLKSSPNGFKTSLAGGKNIRSDQAARVGLASVQGRVKNQELLLMAEKGSGCQHHSQEIK